LKDAAASPGGSRLSLSLCLAGALVACGLGLGLRRAIPVIPVDEPFREVLRFYRSLPPLPAREGRSVAPPASNTPETRAPY